MPLRVLVVDDHPSFRSLASRLLTVGDFDVIGTTSNGTDALREVARLRPDVVLLDVLLPDIDGIEVAKRLARLAAPPIVVLVSSRTRSELGARLADVPVRGFLSKDELTLRRLADLLE